MSMSSSSSSSYSAWQWTSCGLHPRTLSFRQEQQQEEEENNNDSRHMMQQAYNYSSVDSFCTASDDAEAAEAIIRAVRSDRLLFEPDEDDVLSCFMAASCKKQLSKKQAVDVEDDDDDKLDGTVSKAAAATAAFGGAMAMSMESQDPYRDFRESMEAMVMSQQQQQQQQQQQLGVKDYWCWLEEMLGWYLRANAKTTHGLIVGAFVDLLVSLTASTTTAHSSSSSSPATPAAATNDEDCSSSSSEESDCDCERTSPF